MLGIIGMQSANLTNELLKLYDASVNTPTASAFVQQRSKLKVESFEEIFKGFSKQLCSGKSSDLPVFAIDGSDIRIATNPDDVSSYFPDSNGQKGYNLLHLNALYDLNKNIYVDAVIQKRLDWNEHEALIFMIDNSPIQKALIIADRGYESIITWHISGKRDGFFLFVLKMANPE